MSRVVDLDNQFAIHRPDQSPVKKQLMSRWSEAHQTKRLRGIGMGIRKWSFSGNHDRPTNGQTNRQTYRQWDMRVHREPHFNWQPFVAMGNRLMHWAQSCNDWLLTITSGCEDHSWQGFMKVGICISSYPPFKLLRLSPPELCWLVGEAVDLDGHVVVNLRLLPPTNSLKPLSYPLKWETC